MLTLHFFRHGETNFNAEGRVQGQFDSILTDNGIAQAEAARPTVEGLGISATYSSSNVRARHTAEIMTQNLPLDLTLLDDLKEIKMGILEQQLYADLAKTMPDAVKSFVENPEDFNVEGGETFEQLRVRGVSAIEDIIALEKTGTVLVVAHGAILKTVFSHYAGLGLGNLQTPPRLGNCSHSIMEVEGEMRRIIQIGNEPATGTVWQSQDNSEGA